MKNALFLLLSSILLFSCGSGDVMVVVDKEDLSSGKFTIDGNKTYAFKDSLIQLQLPSGKHSVTLDAGPSREFFVGDKGGLLNLDGQEYVAFTVSYEERNSEARFSTDMMSPNQAAILIDSFIILQKRNDAQRRPSDTFFNELFPKLLAAKNGNYIPELQGLNRGYDSSKQVSGLKKFGKGKLYVEKFWDYSPGEDIPQTLEVNGSQSTVFKQSATRVAVLRAGHFLSVASISPEIYFLKNMSAKSAMDDREDRPAR